MSTQTAQLSFEGQGTILKGTVAVDLASVATLATTECTVTITGANVGDICLVGPPAAGLTAGMCICNAVVSASNTVKIRVFNGSAGTIDEASGTWNYVLIRS
jgi:hypothetical protein